jgi:hypothetical protein
MEAIGAFGAVVLTPASATGDFGLETEIVRLQHNFQTIPSHVQFALGAYVSMRCGRRKPSRANRPDRVGAICSDFCLAAPARQLNPFSYFVG